ncbi:MAG: dockerin type I domain-containing protein [bacterium]|nr:dockerin type I domain-containing protein [bacterium]
MKQKLSFIAVLLLLPALAWATDYSSSNFTVQDPILSSGTATSTSTNFGLGQSLGQTAIGKSTSTSYQLWSGFQYFFTVSANTLTATAGDGQVALSWTSPSTYLGVSVGDYDVGVGTVSGSYTFENAGNVTSYTKTGLSNGATYYFKIKAKTASGTFLVFSNEASAQPSGEAAAETGGGGSSTILAGSLNIKGLSSPGATLIILRNGNIVATATADNQALFETSLTGITPGLHNFGLYAIDREGIKNATYSFQKNIVHSVVSSVTAVLSPTSRLSHTIIKQGENLTASGYTMPNAEVSIWVDSKIARSANSNQAGFWNGIINTSALALGKHEIKVQARQGTNTSQFSILLEFEVDPEKSVPTPPPKAPGVPGAPAQRSDLNEDGRVNLVDFSILLYHWQRPAGSSLTADINKNGFVDLIDFSIMMYDWTG